MSEPQVTSRKSDLPVRAASAVVMVVIAGTALWLGGWVWKAFVGLVALGVLWEWRGLVAGFQPSPMKRGLWNAGGLVYVGLGTTILALMNMRFDGLYNVALILLAVIGTDVGAYFAGRTFGGPKIAPKISPSKTWSGLVGGAVGAAIALVAVQWIWSAGACEALLGVKISPSNLNKFGFDGPCSFADVPTNYVIYVSLIAGPLIAIVAQAGDFFESWMKRRAGVKDSGKLIPGHGGLFDRVDGLLAVCFVLGVLSLHSFISPQ